MHKILNQYLLHTQNLAINSLVAKMAQRKSDHLPTLGTMISIVYRRQFVVKVG